MKRRGFIQALAAAAAGIAGLSAANPPPPVAPLIPPPKKRSNKPKKRESSAHPDPQVDAVMAMVAERGEVIECETMFSPDGHSIVRVTYAYPCRRGPVSSPYLNHLAAGETKGRSLRSVSVETECDSLTLCDVGFGPKRTVRASNHKHIIRTEWV